MNTVLIANVGTTAEPIIKAVQTAAAEDTLQLFIAYGKAILKQDKPPRMIVEEVTEQAKRLKVPVLSYELNGPEEFDNSFAFYKNLVDQVSATLPERVIIDVTGGTKVMAAALIHATLTKKWNPEIIFEYMGGERGESGRVKNEFMNLKRDAGVVTTERLEQVLVSLCQNEFSQALFLSQYLPTRGDSGFVKEASAILWQWDNFHYDEAMGPLLHLVKDAELLSGNHRLSKISDTIMRLGEKAAGIVATVKMLKMPKNESKPEYSISLANNWLNIAGDAIANAQRRCQDQPGDCVLRCYRAIEIVTQCALFKFGIDAGNPNWDLLNAEKQKQYCIALHKDGMPDLISLDAGITLLELLTRPISKEIIQQIKEIEQSRNYSYLEHGYRKIQRKTAQSSMLKMENIINEILRLSDIQIDPMKNAYQLRIDA